MELKLAKLVSVVNGGVSSVECYKEEDIPKACSYVCATDPRAAGLKSLSASELVI